MQTILILWQDRVQVNIVGNTCSLIIDSKKQGTNLIVISNVDYRFICRSSNFSSYDSWLFFQVFMSSYSTFSYDLFLMKERGRDSTSGLQMANSITDPIGCFHIWDNIRFGLQSRSYCKWHTIWGCDGFWISKLYKLLHTYTSACYISNWYYLRNTSDRSTM